MTIVDELSATPFSVWPFNGAFSSGFSAASTGPELHSLESVDFQTRSRAMKRMRANLLL